MGKFYVPKMAQPDFPNLPCSPSTLDASWRPTAPASPAVGSGPDGGRLSEAGPNGKWHLGSPFCLLVA